MLAAGLRPALGFEVPANVWAAHTGYILSIFYQNYGHMLANF